MLKVFRYISLLCSIVMLTLMVMHLLELVSDDRNLKTLVLQVVFLLPLAAQIGYLLVSGKVVSNQQYKEVNTLDNDWAFKENDDQKVHTLPSYAAFLAAIGGLGWFLYFCFAGLNSRLLMAVFQGALNNAPLVIFILLTLIGGVPTLIYNLRTWNRKSLHK